MRQLFGEHGHYGMVPESYMFLLLFWLEPSVSSLYFPAISTKLMERFIVSLIVSRTKLMTLNSNPTSGSLKDFENNDHPEFVALVFGLSGITNLVCTGLTAWKAW
jgi:hypothetical protein